MSRKQLEMVRFLSIHNRSMSGKELVNALKVTPRSIKNYVHEVSGLYGKSIIASSRNGYELHTNTVSSLLVALDDQKIPQAQEERSLCIVKQLMLHHHSGLNVFDLSDMLRMSYSTAKTVICKMNKVLSAYHIAFPCENDCVYMQGSEKDKHRLISYAINEEVGNNCINLDLLHKNFDSMGISALQTIIYQTFEKYIHYLNDSAALNLLLRLLIMIDRELNGEELDSEQTGFMFTLSQGEAFLDSLRQQIEQRFSIAFNDYEYFELHMLLRTNADFSLGVSSIVLKDAVGEDASALIREYVRMIDNLYMINLSASTFTISFTLHLKNLIFRAKTGRFIKNPITQAIKNNSPTVFDIATYVALDLMDCYHLMVGEDETASLAIHISAEIKGQSANIHKIPAVLICPDYHDMTSRILNTMVMNFGNQLNLVDSATDETQCREKLREQEIVIVFLIIPLTQHVYYANSKVVQISPINFTSQFSRIQSVIPKELGEGKSQKLCVDFHTFFEKDPFLHESVTVSRERILQLLRAALTEEKYVDSDFHDDVCQRENVATAAFGGTATSHVIEMDAMKTSIAAAMSKNGIQWGPSTVYTIFLLAISKVDRRKFRNVYESLISLFGGPAMMPLVRSYAGFQDSEKMTYNSIHPEKYPQK